MHYRRYALVAAGMLATGVIITAPSSGAAWQDTQQGTISISVMVPTVPAATTDQSKPAKSQPPGNTAPSTTAPSPKKQVIVTPPPVHPPVTPTKDATPPPKEPVVDPAPNSKEPVNAKPATEPLGPFITPAPSDSATPVPDPVPTEPVIAEK
ncbi:MAG: hypothetical protein ABWX90_03845 [Candidatus Saccharimonadales bacterium]